MTAAGDVIARGFGHLLFSQVSSRVVTFVLNILVVRKLPPEIYGVAVIQFHLITTTILTFSREGVRRACLRGVQLGHKTESDLKSIIPLSWFCVPQGLVWSVVVCLFVLAFPGALEDRSYVAGVLLHGLAAFIESCSEPAYILSTCLLVFKLQLTVETLASLAKCFATLLFLVPGLQIPPLIAFGLAAMVYSTTLLIGYWAYFVYKGKLKDMISVQYLTLARVKDIDGGMLSAYASFTFQAIEKHFLGEGEKFVMAAFQPPYDQGVYGLVNNLGSIVVRTVFQPFEQAIFTAFSMSTKSKEGEEDSDSLKGQATLLTLILKLVFIFGGIFIAFGPSYSFTLIWFSYGKEWAMTEAPRILSIYCFYVSAMALNGVSEAFMHATADATALKSINVSLVVFSILHSIASIALVTKFGTYGVVVAGCISMLTRVAYCFSYGRKYFSTTAFSFRSVLPSLASAFAGLSCALLVHLSGAFHLPNQAEASLRDISKHFLLGCFLGLSLLYVLWKVEKETWQSLRDLSRQKQKQK